MFVASSQVPPYVQAGYDWLRDHKPMPYAQLDLATPSLADRLFVYQGEKLGSSSRAYAPDPLTYSFRNGTFSALCILSLAQDKAVMRELTAAGVLTSYPRELTPNLSTVPAVLDGIRVGLFNSRPLTHLQKQLVADTLCAFHQLVEARRACTQQAQQANEAYMQRFSEVLDRFADEHFADYNATYLGLSDDAALRDLGKALADAEDARSKPPSWWGSPRPCSARAIQPNTVTQ